MPHATENGTTPLTNGEKSSMPSSKFISHVASYPVVSDGISNFKAHPYGRKSIDLTDSAYQRFGKPLEPYLETPLAYAKPYVEKADALADSGLEHVDAHFPIVTKDTNTVIETGKSYVFYPLKVASDGKDYVLNTWDYEYKRAQKTTNYGPGLVTGAIAIFSTELHVAADVFHAVADFLGPKYEDSKKKASDYVRQAKEDGDSYTKKGADKLGELQSAGEQKAGELQKAGEEKFDQAKSEASKTKDDASKKADQAKSEATKAKDDAQKKVSSK